MNTLRNILLKGGNAVDAAIASLFCIGVMDAHSAGIGGGHFMTIYNATAKKCYAIDAREVAPANASEKMYIGNWNASQKGWLSIAVPGEIHGIWTAYSKYGGGVEWKTIVDPTIQLLKEGHPVSQALSKALKEEQKNILSEPTMAMFINSKTGKIYEAGEQITTRENFMEFLQNVSMSSDPVQLFYNSTLTQQMVDEIQQNGGIIQFSDFVNYRANVYDEDSLIYTELSNGYRICGPPPPSGSAVTEAIIKILDEYSNEEVALDVMLHRYIEASKFAFAERSKLSDMAMNKTAFTIAKHIASGEYASKIKSLITETSHPSEYYGGDFEPLEDSGTTHISVIDSEGNAVSVTSTINLLFGSGVASKKTGVIWNDEMDDFSSPDRPNYFHLHPSKANFIRPGKRPMSSASPLIMHDPNNSEKIFVLGAAGGSKIISGVAFVAMRAMWNSENIKYAVDAARVHNQLTPNITLYEKNLPEECILALKRRGHVMVQRDNLSVVTALRKDSNAPIYANSDYRKGVESSPAGF
uniref:Gamma-glutamyltranspeptidase 1 n=1 Tax=Syphacia muris TaxID=451379 RepID=A0A158R5X6_9BILA